MIPTDQNQTPVAVDLPAGVPPLRSLYIYAAGSCNLACRHCWITPNFQPNATIAREIGTFVQVEHVRSAIEQGRALGLISAKLTGGEPTLHPRFRELLDLLAQAGLGTIIETNATLLDDDLAKYMREHSSVNFISVSLDGADAATHDYMRAVPGSFDRTIAGIRSLRRVGYRPQIICSLYRGNASQAAQVVKLAEELGCESVKYNLIQEMGRGEHFNDTQGLSIDEILELNRKVEKEIIPNTDLRVVFDIPFAFRPISRIMRGSLDRCGVMGILGILPGGDLALCGIGMNIPDLVYGNLGRDALRDVWCASPGLLDLRAKVPAQLEGVCAECLHRDFCLGSCLANNYHSSGSVNAPYQFCARAHERGLFPATRLVNPVTTQ